MDAYKYDWGSVNVEGYLGNEIFLVFNVDITTSINSQNAIKFVTGKVFWGSKNFPSSAIIKISFDIRGQSVIMHKSTSFKKELLSLFQNLNIINKIQIDFLR